MEDEVVRRRAWLTRQEFLDLVGAVNLIPGPNSTELAIHIGHRRAGWPGLLVAGVCFIVPAAVMVWAIAWAYVRFGRMPAVGAVLYGVKPVIVAVVVQALLGLGRSAVKTPALGVIGVAALGLVLAGAHELLVLAGAGVAALVGARVGRAASPGALMMIPTASLVAGSAGTIVGTATGSAASLGGLFLVFVKIGSVLFGSGYVLLAFLRADLVERLGWLTEASLLDAVAVGQITPGPVFTTATFIGYLVAGHGGAAAATVGIFLPAFVFVAASGPLIPWLRRSRPAGHVLDGVNVASLALMGAVTWQLGRGAIADVPTTLLAFSSGVALLVFRVNSTWLVVAGALAGIALRGGLS